MEEVLKRLQQLDQRMVEIQKTLSFLESHSATQSNTLGNVALGVFAAISIGALMLWFYRVYQEQRLVRDRL